MTKDMYHFPQQQHNNSQNTNTTNKTPHQSCINNTQLQEFPENSTAKIYKKAQNTQKLDQHSFLPENPEEPDLYIPRLELSQLSLYSNVGQNNKFAKSQISPIFSHGAAFLQTVDRQFSNINFEYSPRPSTGRSRKASESQKASSSKSGKSTTGKSTNINSIPNPTLKTTQNMGSTPTKPITVQITPSQLQISQIYTEPYYELSGEFSYGCAEKMSSKKSNTDGNNNFSPDAKQLKKEGGKSIKLYENWRIMQYHQNVVMKKFLLNHGINGSVLPTCTSFDMWKDKEWRDLYKSATGNGLDQDPCPDCDVRFFKDKDDDRRFSFKIAPASMLHSGTNWKKRKFLNSVFVIGLPQHITIACVREFSDHVVFEFFDPAGASGDTNSVKAVKEWTQTYLKDMYSTTRHTKPVVFTRVCNSINCQSDKADVMCQTWIWWWVYWRMVRQANVSELTKHLKDLIKTKATLAHIAGFKQWLVNLYSLGYLQRECAFERKAAELNTPASKEVLKRMVEGDLKDYNFTMSTEFCMSCRIQSNESFLTDGLCKTCYSQISRESSRISQTNLFSRKSRSSSKSVSKSTSKSSPKVNQSSSENHVQSTSKSAPTSKTSTFSFVENHHPEKYQTQKVEANSYDQTEAVVISTTASRTSLNESSSNLANVVDYRRRES